MNIFIRALLISIFINSIFFEKGILWLFLTFLAVDYLLVLLYRKYSNREGRRKWNSCHWNRTGDPTSYCSYDVNLDKIDEILKEHNDQNPKQRITYTHIALKSLGYGMKQFQYVGRYSFGNFKKIDFIRLSVIVDIEGKNLMNLLVDNCDKLSITDIAGQIKGKIGKIKTKQDKKMKRQMNIFRVLPSYVLAVLLEFIGFVSYNLYCDFKPIKVDKANFGYGLVTNVSSFGLQTVLPSHVRMARTLIVQTINEPRVLPVIVDGKIIPQKTMKIGFCFDPRFGNGDDFLRCLSNSKEVWDNPKKFF